MIETIAIIYIIIGFIIALAVSGGNPSMGVLFRSTFLWLPIAIHSTVSIIAEERRFIIEMWKNRHDPEMRKRWRSH